MEKRAEEGNVMKAMNGTGIQNMCLIAVMTAVMCIFGPMSVPIGPVPVSLTVFTVCFSAYVLGMKRGTIAYLIYLLIGFIGVPVLSGYSGGASKVFGPTGGYLFGFIFMALISGLAADRFHKNVFAQFVGMLSGLLLCYTLGTVWLSFVTGMSLEKAIAAGVLPFVGLDFLKIIVAILVGRPVRNRLKPFLHEASA